MKDLPAVRTWIQDTVNKYYKQLGLNKVPIVLYGLDDAPKEVRTHKTGKNYKKYAAVSFISTGKKPHFIILNLPYHRSIRELEDTIAHELLHIRFPKMEHGEDFWKRLGMVLMGKQYRKVKK